MLVVDRDAKGNKVLVGPVEHNNKCQPFEDVRSRDRMGAQQSGLTNHSPTTSLPAICDTGSRSLLRTVPNLEVHLLFLRHHLLMVIAIPLLYNPALVHPCINQHPLYCYHGRRLSRPPQAHAMVPQAPRPLSAHCRAVVALGDCGLRLLRSTGTPN